MLSSYLNNKKCYSFNENITIRELIEGYNKFEGIIKCECKCHENFENCLKCNSYND